MENTKIGKQTTSVAIVCDPWFIYLFRKEKRSQRGSKAQEMEVTKEGVEGIRERKGEKKWSMV